MKKYKVVDLFSGAGGMSLGFEQTKGFETIAAIDIWQPAIETILYNHPKMATEFALCAPVDEVFQKESKYESIVQRIKEIGVDVVIGGPPCQGMSLAGKRLNSDPRNQLFKSFVRAVEVLQPMAFVMENVPGLLSIDNGKVNNAILQAFADIGYNHFDQHVPMILKSETYGVPQIRRRLFYVGFRSDLSPIFESWPPKPTHRAHSKGKNDEIRDLFSGEQNSNALPAPISVCEAISDLSPLQAGQGADEQPYPENIELTEFQKLMRDWMSCPRSSEKPMIYNHEAPKHTEKLIKLISEAKPGTSVDPKYTDSKKWDPNYSGYTVKALGAGGGSTNRRAFHYSPMQPRGSTIRENARIQSFPDWYRFIGAKTHQMSQVGNAVPPLMAKAIAQALYVKLLNERH